jgi:hypothetical protein
VVGVLDWAIPDFAFMNKKDLGLKVVHVPTQPPIEPNDRIKINRIVDNSILDNLNKTFNCSFH